MYRPAVLVGAAVLLFAGPERSYAQQLPDTAHLATGRIIGRVVDAATEQPIQGVSVRLSDFERFVRLTDSRGAFVFSGVPRGVRELVIEHIGYGSGTHLVNVPGGETVTFDAALEPDAIALDALVITAQVRATQLVRVGFHYRARRGFGRFFSTGEVTTSSLREALYSVPRLEFVQTSAGSSRRVMFRMPRGSCVPEIYLDGVRQNWAAGEIENVVGGVDIEAVEVYRGLETPAEFMHNPGFAPCGAIVVWSRR